MEIETPVTYSADEIMSDAVIIYCKIDKTSIPAELKEEKLKEKYGRFIKN